MAGSLTVRQARLVLPERVVTGDLVVEDGVISQIGPRIDRAVGLQVDGSGLVVLPGPIDLAVHAVNADALLPLARTAVAGGVTSFVAVLDRPGDWRAAAAVLPDLLLHAGLWVRADEDRTGAERARGIWVPGEVLASPEAEQLFASAEKLLVVDNVDPPRLAERARMYADSRDPADHPRIHDVDSAVAATQRTLELAQKHGRPVHLVHPSTAEETALLGGRPPSVTASACTPHLFLDEHDLARLGTRAITCPPVRGPRHQQALWDALRAGVIEVIASGHRAVPARAKDLPYPTTPPGLRAVGTTLPLLLDAVVAGRCTLPDVARWTAEAPARAARLPRKGRLETGYDGDLVLVDLGAKRTIAEDATEASPWAGRTLSGWPVLTVVLGEPVFREGEVLAAVRGRPI